MDKLRELNFKELLHIDAPNVAAYTFDQYRMNGYEHPSISGYCIACEEKGCNVAADDDTYRLTHISHGAHAIDYFSALKAKPDLTGWHDEPIVFVYETPSLDYGIYRAVAYKGYNKRPSKDWYWIHGDQAPKLYPDRFGGGEYGGFVWGAVQTFRLSNVYITNLVKCGLNNNEGKFKGLDAYNEETIKECYSRILEKELDILNPKIVFAVGSAVEKWVSRFVQGRYYVQPLPHPAGRRRGLRDEHFKAIYFWVAARALHKAGVIDTNEGSDLARMFLERYDVQIG